MPNGGSPDAALIARLRTLETALDQVRAIERARGQVNVRVRSSVNVTIATATDTAVTFNAERWDTADMWSPGAPTRLTATLAGLYQIGASLIWAANATGIRVAFIRLNGATPISNDSPATLAADNVGFTPHTMWQMAVGDYVEVVVRQTSGGNLNLLTSNAQSPEFWVARIG